MKIVITGGHFSPAYALIQKLKKDNDIVVIGRKYAFEGDTNETYEYKICQKENIPFHILNTGRLQRNLNSRTLPSMLKFPKGIYDAQKILRSEKPDVILSFGGYVGLPVALAGRILGLPIVLHEQTQNAGVASGLIAKVADVICVSFESSLKNFKGKNVIVTGNPLRDEIFESHPVPFRTIKPIIYVTGGSTGSHAVNKAIYETLPMLLKDFTVVHQTGNSKEFNDFSLFSEYKKSLSSDVSSNYIVSEFFNPDEVSSLFQNAKIVVSRAGINTVLELMAAGTVSILVPLPIGQKNEQKDNALLFQQIGLGVMIEQKDLTGELLLKTIHAMIKERNSYKKNAEKALTFIKKDAADKIIEQIYLYGRRKDRIAKRGPS